MEDLERIIILVELIIRLTEYLVVDIWVMMVL